MPYCGNCGNKLGDDDLFCTRCGNAVRQSVVQNAAPQVSNVSTAGEMAVEHSSYSNPTFRKGLFENVVQTGRTMTIQGAINKTIFLLIALFVGAFISWDLGFYAWSSIIVLSIIGLALAFVISFAPTSAPYLSIVYAGIEGLCLGALSNMMESVYPGIVSRAVVDTVVITFVMLFFYKTRLLQVTDTFKTIVVGATIGICISQIVIFILQSLGFYIPFIFEGGWLSIVIGLVVIAVAAFNLALDFHFFKEGEESGLPSYFEWYAAFGLMVTLVWLYVSILRLLSILQGDD